MTTINKLVKITKNIDFNLIKSINTKSTDKNLYLLNKNIYILKTFYIFNIYLYNGKSFKKINKISSILSNSNKLGELILTKRKTTEIHKKKKLKNKKK